jgi:hypothetical protein
MTLKDRLIDATLDKSRTWRMRRRFVKPNSQNNWRFEIPAKNNLQFPGV